MVHETYDEKCHLYRFATWGLAYSILHFGKLSNLSVLSILHILLIWFFNIYDIGFLHYSFCQFGRFSHRVLTFIAYTRPILELNTQDIISSASILSMLEMLIVSTEIKLYTFKVLISNFSFQFVICSLCPAYSVYWVELRCSLPTFYYWTVCAKKPNLVSKDGW